MGIEITVWKIGKIKEKKRLRRNLIIKLNGIQRNGRHIQNNKT
jgi:hypothetical protein